MLGFTSIGFLHAQIGVNSTTPKVTLDVEAGATDATTAEGLTAPRLTLTQLASKDAKYGADQTGTLVFVTNASGTATTKTRNVIAPGYYYFDGTLWQTTAPDAATRFFYMPSVVLTTNITDPSYNAGTQTFTFDLYTAYANQFGMVSPVTTVKNPSATSLAVSSSASLEYFVTYYDNSVYQNVAITNAGVLTYKLVPGFTFTGKTFMNIVFKVK